MKNLVKFFMVIALSAIFTGASAQSSSTPYVVHKGSTRVFSITEHTDSKYAWTVEFVSSTEVSTEESVPSYTPDNTKGSLSVVWNGKGKYKITVVESSKVDCSDASVNTKEYWVNVIESDFEVSVVWVKSAIQCAIANSAADLDNDIAFTVSRTGGVFSATKTEWTFEYEYQVSEDGGTSWTVLSSGDAVGDLSVGKDNTSTLTFTKSIALDSGVNGDYLLKVRIKNAKDGYGSVAPTSTFATATYHRLPTTSDISID